MQGIISLLDAEHYAKVEAIWRELEADCGLVGIKMTPLPHFSWQIAEGYDLDKVRALLSSFALSTRPFSIHTGGIGLFPGSIPIIYIPLVKDANLLRLHETLWEGTQQAATGMNRYYSPAYWVPHVTLAYGDVTLTNLNCALERLAFQSLDWEIQIDQISVVYQEEGKDDWLQDHYEFQG